MLWPIKTEILNWSNSIWRWNRPKTTVSGVVQFFDGVATVCIRFQPYPRTIRATFNRCQQSLWEVLAMGAGNPPAVWVTCQWSGFGPEKWFFSVPDPSKNQNPLCLGGVVTGTSHSTIGFGLGCNWTTVLTSRFLQHRLQWSYRVLIISWHDEYAACAVWRAL